MMAALEMWQPKMYKLIMADISKGGIMERMQVYARDEDVAKQLRIKIQNIPNNLMEELRTKNDGFKFEFFGTIFNGVELMALGASSFGKV